MAIFPIKCAAYETPHYTSSPYQYQKVFMAAREEHAPKVTWYAYDAILLSRTEIEFVVYDMHDNCYGGIGEEVARFRAPVSVETTYADVEKAIWRAAENQRAAELYAQERAVVSAYADEIRKELDA